MRLGTYAALLTVVSLIAFPARAEEDEIVVTATRIPTPAHRLPARVDVIDRADIEARNIATLPDALGSEAVQAGGAGQQASLFIRGANSNHTLALLDGVRLNDASAPNGQYDFGLDTLGALDRMEIVRGPASAVYGADAIGGVVNMIPRRGGDDVGYGEVAHGSFNTARALAGASGEAGAFAYGVTAEHFETGGHDLVPARMATHSGDTDGARASTLTASARYDGGEYAFDALARVRDSRSAFDTFSGGPFFDLRADDPNLENETEQRLWRLGAERRVASAVGLRLSGGQVPSERAENDDGAETSAARSERRFAEASAIYSHEQTTLTAGVAYERDAIDTRPPFAAPLSAREQHAAAFAVGQLGLSDRVTATGAIRYDDYENFGGVDTYTLGAVAELGPLRAFASYGTAFKAPTLSERFETSAFNIANPDLKPENSRSIEVGADWRASDRIEMGGSLYSTRIDNLIQYEFSQLRNVNIGQSRIDGAESYLRVSPAPWATLRLSYAWTDARNLATGARLARRPEHTLRLDVRATPTERLTLALNWSYVGARADVTYADSGAFKSAAGVTPAYDFGALSVTYNIAGGAALFARIDNVADATYEQPAAFAGAPRSVHLGLRAKF